VELNDLPGRDLIATGLDDLGQGHEVSFERAAECARWPIVAASSG
jgi:hypothetical protein